MNDMPMHDLEIRLRGFTNTGSDLSPPNETAVWAVAEIDKLRDENLKLSAANNALSQMNEHKPESFLDVMAVFHVQDPLTGGAVPVIRVINERTTVADLMGWHQRNCHNPKLWETSWFDVRIVASCK